MPGGWELGGWELPLPAEESGKEVPSVLKAEEEIAKFTVRKKAWSQTGSYTSQPLFSPAQVDEHLSDVERTVLYLNGGQLIQQRHAIAK